MNILCRRLGIAIPILQAPTGSVAGPELAAAVSRAGGLGSLGLTWTPEDAAVQNVSELRASLGLPFAVNYALAFPPATLPAVLDAGAPIVTLSWGDPAPFVPLIRRAGALLMVQVGNRDGARRALDLGLDALICQGIEAGGHVQSTTPLERLLPQIVAEAGDVPVVAAGGIADGAGIARVMRMGAQGAMLGTRFVATAESRAHEQYKRRILAAAEGESTLTVCFSGGWPHAPHRVIRNATLEAWEGAGCPQPGQRPGEGDIIARAASGEPIARYEDTAPRIGMSGDVEQMALYAGTGVGAIKDLPPAGELVARLWRETVRLLPTA